ncbi:MAG: alkaline phosphatase [Prevotella sp.]|nr:alkaline phosphatase [Prevotella sp.]
MKNRLSIILLMFLFALTLSAQGKAKYVFYFIGDGMGVNQVNAAETYLGALQGRIGIEPLCFPSFPYSAFVNTQSATNGVTDSAAGGTALACGQKTKNGTLGMLKDLTTSVSSIADWARNSGAAVGITTSVAIDHATPAAFYAHVKERHEQYTIGKQLVESANDFYAGSDFTIPTDPEYPNGNTLYEEANSKGFTIARGYADYQNKAANAKKMILLQSEEASKADRYSIPYALDRKDGDLTLTDITRAGIDFLMKKQGEKNGFFMMIEGGKIDWACHANDLAFIPELIDMDNAVKVAYDFYKQHPDETLIIVTADHETGGIVLSRGLYEINLAAVGNQRITIEKLGKELHKMHDVKGDKLLWDDVKTFLAENFGFWDKISLTDEQTQRLVSSFKKIMDGTSKDQRTLYQNDDELAVTVRNIMSECAQVGWHVTSHSNGYVPCFAIGVGAEQIHGRIDNTEIPKIVAKAAGWKSLR